LTGPDENRYGIGAPLSRYIAKGGRLGKAVWLVPALLLAGGPAFATDVNLNAYGDVDYVVQRQTDGTSVVNNSFMSPRLELFLTATQDRLAFLAETMFEVGDNNEFGVDIERVEVAYIFADWFRVRAGRFHTAIGYYNDAYHHGRYFQTTVDRPEMVRFEDEGGLIPAHSVGLHADGRVEIGRLGSIRYDVDLANGRGQKPDEVTNLTDPNNGKMVNARLRLEPSVPDGLIIGGNVLVDSIDALTVASDPTSPTVFIREMMLGAHVAYLENNIHLIAEYLRVSHAFAGLTGITQAGFVEAGYTLGAFVPYARGELVRFPAPGLLDPFYGQNLLGARGSFRSAIAGLRFTASDYIALKLEGGYTKLDAGGSISTGAVQCAFAF
jgi:hypothetical protein